MFLNLKLLLPLVRYLLRGHYFPARAILDGLSSHQVLDSSGQALIEIANHCEFLGLFNALREVRINYLQLNFLRSLDSVDCLVRPKLKAVVDDIHSVSDVFCCAKICMLEAHGG